MSLLRQLIGATTAQRRTHRGQKYIHCHHHPDRYRHLYRRKITCEAKVKRGSTDHSQHQHKQNHSQADKHAAEQRRERCTTGYHNSDLAGLDAQNAIKWTDAKHECEQQNRSDRNCPINGIDIVKNCEACSEGQQQNQTDDNAKNLVGLSNILSHDDYS
jgi:hypothetical protein